MSFKNFHSVGTGFTLPPYPLVYTYDAPPPPKKKIPFCRKKKKINMHVQSGAGYITRDGDGYTCSFKNCIFVSHQIKIKTKHFLVKRKQICQYSLRKNLWFSCLSSIKLIWRKIIFDFCLKNFLHRIVVYWLHFGSI